MNIHEQIFQSLRDYFIITAFVLVLAAILFIIFFIRQKNALRHQQPPVKNMTPSPSIHVITSHDIRAIAGEDMVATQLDLARAYIEIGKKQLARKILEHAGKQGNVSQRQEAHQLLKNLQ